MQRLTGTRTIAVLLLVLLFLPASASAARDPAPLLAKIKAVGGGGAGNAEAAAAWKELVRIGTPALLPTLAAMDADPVAANWLRAAATAIAEKSLAAHQLSAKELEAFVLQKKHNGAARRIAYEWLVQVDPTAPGRLLPGMLNDPGAELRRDAVAAVIKKADADLVQGKKDAATATFRTALDAARDADQVEAVAKQLKTLGVEVDLASHYGSVRRWLLVTPFDNKGGIGFAAVYPPETGVDPGKVYKGKAGEEARWIGHRTTDPRGLVDLNKVLGKRKATVAYAFAIVDSPTEQKVQLRAGCMTAIKVFLNGKRLMGREEYHHGIDIDQHVGTGTLKAGRNEILVKVCQNDQSEPWAQAWQFQLRICDALGGAVPFKVMTPSGERRRQGDKEKRRQGDRETRRPGDKEKRRQGDRETRRPGDRETRRQGDWNLRLFCLLVSRSPGLLVSSSPGLLVSLSPLLRGSPAGDWPQFRGPGGSSVSADKGLPVKWTPTENVRWKAALPGRGLSCPVIAGGRVYVTACSGPKQNRLHVLCFNAADGVKLWERQFTSTGNTQCHSKTCMAAPTPAADGKAVFALFATGDLAALDRDGNLLWYRSLVRDYPDITNQVGMAASPVLWKDVLLLPMENAGDSFAAGLDTRTGKNLWRSGRFRDINWVTPLVVERDGKAEVLFQTTNDVTAYEPRTGKVMWTLSGRATSSVASPTQGEGLLLIPGREFLALRPAKEGSKPELVWKSNKLSSGYTSPVYYQGRVYALTHVGLNCVDAKNGAFLWQQRVKGQFSASPVLADGKAYVTSEEGIVTVIQLGKEPEILAANDMKQTLLATPAISGGTIYLRSDQALFCVGTKAK